MADVRLNGAGFHDHEDSDDDLVILEFDAAAAAVDFDDRGNEVDDAPGLDLEKFCSVIGT